MLEEKTRLFCNKISGNTRLSHVKIYKTSTGPLFLRNCCLPSFVEGLKASDPNIRADTANILVARLGRCLTKESINHFFQRLLESETLPGL